MGQLADEQHQQLVPAAERLNVFVTLILGDQAIKRPFRQKFTQLAKNILPYMHFAIILLLNTKIAI